MNTHVNKVLIKPDSDSNALPGTSIEWGIERVSITGTVIAVPDRLHFSKKKGSGGEYESRVNSAVNFDSLEYGTDMELRVGDRVIFRFTSHAKDKCRYGILTPYDQVYAKLNGDEIIPVNGRVFGRPVETDGKNITHMSCEVVAFGKKLRGYKFHDSPEPDTPLKKGMTAWVKNAMPVDHDRSMVVFHRKDILCYSK